MAKTIAIFGAGSGLGASVARRFGAEDHRVALVGRREAPLRSLAAELGTEGIEAAAFSADLTDLATIPALVDQIRARFGQIDVIYYAPTSSDAGFVAAADLSAEVLQARLDLYLLAPVEVVRAVLPEMLERGSGSILVGQGASAVMPQPQMSGVGPAMAATRNWLYSLNGELASRGIYVGTIAIAAMIAGSEAHQALTSGAISFDLPEGMELPVVDPDELADLLWGMSVDRDRVEIVHPDAGPLA